MTAESQFEPFMRQHQNMVFSTAMRLVNNQAEAEDIAQEVFLRAYERFAEVGRSPTVDRWLKRVAINMGLNHLTRYRRRWTFFSELLGENDGGQSTETAFPSWCDLGEELAAADQHRHVEQALLKLPPAQRVPLVLFYLEGLSYLEIAAKLKISVGKVKTDMFRGRAGLRAKLQASPARAKSNRSSEQMPVVPINAFDWGRQSFAMPERRHLAGLAHPKAQSRLPAAVQA